MEWLYILIGVIALVLFGIVIFVFVRNSRRKTNSISNVTYTIDQPDAKTATTEIVISTVESNDQQGQSQRSLPKKPPQKPPRMLLPALIPSLSQENLDDSFHSVPLNPSNDYEPVWK